MHVAGYDTLASKHFILNLYGPECMIQTANPMSLLRLFIFFFILDQCTRLLVSSGRINAATAEISHGLLQNGTWFEAAKRII